MTGTPPRTGRLLAILAGLGLLLAACGGDSDGGGDGGGLNESNAEKVTKQFILDVFGLLTGDVNAQRFVNNFAPECRQNVSAAEVEAAAGFISIFLPQLAEVEIDDVDLGKLKFERTAEGILVVPEDPDGMRVKVDGKFVSATEFFGSLGFEDTEDSPADPAEPLLIVERDGKAYVGDCSQLEDFGGGVDPDDEESSGVTISPDGVRTPVAATSRPGGSRATPIALGSSAVVEDTWRISVVSVNSDAAGAVEQLATAFEPPAPNERMILVTLEVENVSQKDEAQWIEDIEFELTGSRNALYSAFDSKTTCGFIDEPALSDKLFPGGKASGVVCFRIPRDETNLLLVYGGFVQGPTYFKLD